MKSGAINSEKEWSLDLIFCLIVVYDSISCWFSFVGIVSLFLFIATMILEPMLNLFDHQLK